MAQQLFRADERTEKTILVVSRGDIDGASVTKELRAIVKLRTYLVWRDEKAEDPKTVETFVKRMRLALNSLGEEDEGQTY
jgi:hypothetical protein